MTLTPVRPLARNQAYRLTVNGTSVGVGVADRAGNLLDGDSNGTPGGNFLGRFGARERPARVSARAFDVLAIAGNLPVEIRNRRRP